MTRTNRSRFNREGGGYHAEALIMAKAKKKGIVRILICRVAKNSGELRPIHPCDKCRAIAEKLNITIKTIPLEK